MTVAAVMAGWVVAVMIGIAAPQSAMQPSAVERQAIDRVQKTVVRTIDRTLPDAPLERWLRDTFGGDVKIAWEVNDCGEQTGDPARDRGRDFPMCVDVAVPLSGARTLHLLFGVGTFNTGLTRGAPSYAYGVVLDGVNPQRWLKTLGEAAPLGRAASR